MALFQDIPIKCPCGYDKTEHGCLCTFKEAMLHRYCSNEILRPMTAEEREWCVQEADWAGEGSYNKEELSAMTDKDLANSVLHAWLEYVRSHF